jgi:hypothetical protein
MNSFRSRQNPERQYGEFQINIMDLALQAKPASQTSAIQHNSQTKAGAIAPAIV